MLCLYACGGFAVGVVIVSSLLAVSPFGRLVSICILVGVLPEFVAVTVGIVSSTRVVSPYGRLFSICVLVGL